MKTFPLLCICLLAPGLLAGPLCAAPDAKPKERGGFTAATPKPTTLKKFTSEESTPRPKKSAFAKSTPAPKAKVQPLDDAVPAEIAPEAPNAPLNTPQALDGGDDPAVPIKPERAPAATINPEDLVEFAAQPARIQALIAAALELTKLNLTYTYGSDDPSRGGMDCSGTMAYVLRAQGFKDVPRDSSSQYAWSRKGGPFFAVVSKSATSFEFKDLQPGDLLFWTGTYETGREIPISHVMLYLGTEKKSRKRVMFGASDGRSYAGIQRWGVSVFDFKMPNGVAAGERAKVDFVGYGRIPGLRDTVLAEVAEEDDLTSTPSEPSVTPAKPRVAKAGAAKSGSTRKKKRND